MPARESDQVAEVQKVLDSAFAKSRGPFNAALVGLERVLGDINVMMDTMWSRSYHADYMKVLGSSHSVARIRCNILNHARFPFVGACSLPNHIARTLYAFACM
jgi:hypothetical protein